MDERTLQVETPDGVMETFLAMPDSDGPFPPVMLYMDIWGMREQLRDVARTVASEGFACAAPSLYYREGNIHFDRRHPDGRTKSISILDDVDRQRMLDYNAHLTDEMAISDTGALIEHLRTIDKVSKSYAGCFGYCMGGRHVMKVAAAYPDVFRATASYHGTYLATDKLDSPHLGAPKIKGEVYCGYGDEDPFTPREVIDMVRKAFDDSDAVLHEIVHPATKHGYAIPDRDVFNEDASEKDWKVVYDMFRRML